MAIDPICGMTLSDTAQLCAERDGQTFCCCREQSRQRFLARQSGASSTAENQKCCQTKRSDRPASTGSVATGLVSTGSAHIGSGYTGALLKKLVDSDLIQAQSFPEQRSALYRCPMHADVRRFATGDYPICGMALESEIAVASSNSGSNEVKDVELRDMIRRFCVGAILTATLFILAMSHLVAVAVPVPVVVVVVVVVAVPVVVAVVVVVVVVVVVRRVPLCWRMLLQLLSATLVPRVLALLNILLGPRPQLPQLLKMAV